MSQNNNLNYFNRQPQQDYYQLVNLNLFNAVQPYYQNTFIPQINPNFQYNGFYGAPILSKFQHSAVDRNCYTPNLNRNDYQKKRKLERSTSFDCSFCNISFRSRSEYEGHVRDSHVDCEVVGCGYNAPLEVMEVHRLRHITNDKGESILESIEETRKWIYNRKKKHPSNRNRDLESLGECMLEALLRENFCIKKSKKEEDKKSLFYPIISKIKEQPSALLRISNPLRYEQLLKKLDSTMTPYSYNSALGHGHGCPHSKKNGSCKYGNKCKFSNNRSISIPKRPPTILKLLKCDIYNRDKLLIDAIKTIVQLNFFKE